MQIGRDHVHPAVIPYWETIVHPTGKTVGIISLPANAPDKPYKAKRGSTWVTKIRVGSTTRDATREEEARLYQQSGQLRYGLKPILGATVADLDRNRLTEYFTHVLDWYDGGPSDSGELQVVLKNIGLATESAGTIAPNH